MAAIKPRLQLLFLRKSVVRPKCQLRRYSIVQEVSSKKSSFDELGLSGGAIQRLLSLNITDPTNIQELALPPILEGKNVVVNAETGSGKTLCYMMRIQQIIQEQEPVIAEGIRYPIAAVLVPTPELCHQVEEMYHEVSNGTTHSTIVHRNSRLLLRDTTKLVIGIPTQLKNYHLPNVFKHVRLLVVDEADVLLTGGERSAAWSVLKYFKDRWKGKFHQSTVDGEESDIKRAHKELVPQLVFVAATLPSGGSQTVHSLLKKWVPRNTLFINTSHTHMAIASTKFQFKQVTDDEDKFTQLMAILKQQYEVSPLNLEDNGQKSKELTVKSSSNGEPKILIFCNSVKSVDFLYNHLNSGKARELWWTKKAEIFHSNVDLQKRFETLRRFKSGECQVLLTTDLLARGLDIADVSLVLQYDFPLNVAEFLHRSGRTGRAGKLGEVVCFYEDANEEVKNAIQRALENESPSFAHLFSRNKMLRRKLKRGSELKLFPL